jgi:hypothetical protein
MTKHKYVQYNSRINEWQHIIYLLSFIVPSIVQSMFMLCHSLIWLLYSPCLCFVIPFCDSLWYFWVTVNLCSFIIVCLYMYCRWRSSYRDWIPLTCLTRSHLCACSKTRRVVIPLTCLTLSHLCACSRRRRVVIPLTCLTWSNLDNWISNDNTYINKQ